MAEQLTQDFKSEGSNQPLLTPVACTINVLRSLLMPLESSERQLLVMPQLGELLTIVIDFDDTSYG